MNAPARADAAHRAPVSFSRRLPIGAEPCAGGIHFRVWAPRAREVIVELLDPESRVVLTSEGDGYHSGTVGGVGPGARYRFVLDGRGPFPDPASRFQPEGPHGPSEVIDPNRFRWTDADWKGISSEGQVVYEMHLGTFSPEGTWDGAARQFERLRALGVTAVEVMPVADFPGHFGWGYDGVNLFAPTRLYGRPDDFRRFVDLAHAAGLGVLLDVVYNHFGPDGNYLSEFSSHYFTDRYSCDWGAAINFDGPESEPVREFFVSNAEYWLAEFHLDGLRFDATQAVYDHSPEHVLAEIARRARVAALPRTVFLVAENEAQDSSMARPCESGGKGLDALWNDDFHHAARVALTGFREAYFAGYSGTSQELISAARWGYLYQGQRHSWLKKARGSPALDLPSSAFVDFLENHDQVANSGHGKRLWQVAPPGPYRALTALLLLGPGTPLLFQGQEFASSRPFVYFADHLAPLGPLVSKGRRGFLSQFPSLAGPEAQATLPDPTEPSAFERSKLDPEEMSREKDATRLVRDLLRLRKEDPPFRAQGRQELFGAVLSPSAFALRSVRPDAQRLLLVNLGADLPLTDIAEPMLAPPEGHRWALAWSSEHPSYGGKGLAPLYVEENLHLPGGCAILLRPEAVREKESGPRGGGSGAGP